MLPNYYELTRENTNIKELKTYRILSVFNILLKLLSVGLISLTILFSKYYWFLVVGIFIFSMIISSISGNIAKNYKYNIYDDLFEVTKIGFNGNSKILFKEPIKDCRFTTKFAQDTIVTTKELHAAIITNDKKYIMFLPDQYMIGLLENKMKENK